MSIGRRQKIVTGSSNGYFGVRFCRFDDVEHLARRDKVHPKARAVVVTGLGISVKRVEVGVEHGRTVFVVAAVTVEFDEKAIRAIFDVDGGVYPTVKAGGRIAAIVGNISVIYRKTFAA